MAPVHGPAPVSAPEAAVDRIPPWLRSAISAYGDGCVVAIAVLIPAHRCVPAATEIASVFVLPLTPVVVRSSTVPVAASFVTVWLALDGAAGVEKKPT